MQERQAFACAHQFIFVHLSATNGNAIVGKMVAGKCCCRFPGLFLVFFFFSQFLNTLQTTYYYYYFDFLFETIFLRCLWCQLRCNVTFHEDYSYFIVGDVYSCFMHSVNCLGGAAAMKGFPLWKCNGICFEIYCICTRCVRIETTERCREWRQSETKWNKKKK